VFVQLLLDKKLAKKSTVFFQMRKTQLRRWLNPFPYK